MLAWFTQPKIYGDKAQDNMEMIEKAEEDDEDEEGEAVSANKEAQWKLFQER